MFVTQHQSMWIKSALLFTLFAPAACSESPTKEGRSLVVIHDPVAHAANVNASTAASATTLPQLQLVLEEYGAQPDAMPPSDDVRQEAVAAAVRDDDPYRINDSVIADAAS
ncbi:MAG: hypothetical protein ACSLE1_19830 [Sphingobium sp.]